MAQYTETIVDAARQRYVETDMPLRSIAAELQIGESSLQRLVKQYGWPMRSKRVQGLPVAMQLLNEVETLGKSTTPLLVPIGHPEVRAKRASKGDGPNKLSTDGPHPSRLGEERLAPQDDGSSDDSLVEGAAQQASAIERIERLVLKQIKAEEAERVQLGARKRPASSSERSARTLATLTQTLAALRRMRAGERPEPGIPYDDMPRDLDEFRHALARRIRAFVESRTRAGNADGNPGCADVDATG